MLKMTSPGNVVLTGFAHNPPCVVNHHRRVPQHLKCVCQHSKSVPQQLKCVPRHVMQHVKNESRSFNCFTYLHLQIVSLEIVYKNGVPPLHAPHPSQE